MGWTKHDVGFLLGCKKLPSTPVGVFVEIKKDLIELMECGLVDTPL